MRPLIIVGAGGHGLETLWLAKRCNRLVKGFLDDTDTKQNKVFIGIPVLGKIDQYKEFLNCDFIIAIGNCRHRAILVDKLRECPDISFATLIDPMAIVGSRSTIGIGSMVSAGSIITVNVSIGEHCVININSTISHGCKIGSFSTIAPNASIAGDVTIGECVELGMNASIREKLNIESGALIGMGSVLTKNVEKNSIMIGNPSKFHKKID